MSKGDLKTFRGKLFNHSYGKYRPRRRKTIKRKPVTDKNQGSMKEYKIKHLSIYKFDNQFEDKYRTALSSIVIDKFGKGPFNTQETVREIITFCYNYYCDRFIEVCKKDRKSVV